MNQRQDVKLRRFLIALLFPFCLSCGSEGTGATSTSTPSADALSAEDTASESMAPGAEDTRGRTAVDSGLGDESSAEPDTGPVEPEPECTADRICDDGNLCTTDICGYGGVCRFIPNGGDCDDGELCTSQDECDGLACVGVPFDCEDDNPCTDDLCLGDGTCENQPNAEPCDDGNACTVDDKCLSANCFPGAGVLCNDDNPCTADSCLKETGECSSETLEDGSLCQDGNFCTVGDACVASVCVPGVSIECDDENPCTDDSCDPESGFCTVEYNEEPCDDGTVCTAMDQCANGLCVGSDATDCDDGNPCTDDPCDPVAGTCDHVFNTKPCQDADLCTAGDVCQSGVCVPGTLPSCDDNNTCTSDACSPETGECEYVAVEGTCDDGNLCTVGDLCSEGTCAPGEGVVCEDGNPCTMDVCIPETAECSFTPVEDALECDDADGCTELDSCVDGGCLGSPVDCEDGDPCTIGEVCIADECQPGSPKNCNDGSDCTQDACDSGVAEGCVYENAEEGTACVLSSACDVGSCQEGVCTFAEGVDCDDGNPCTIDLCSDATGCTYSANDCGSSALDCLTAFCDPDQGGCVFETDNSLCDDGIGCSVDLCQEGVGCQQEYPVDCCPEQPLTEGFEGGALPVGWTANGSSGTVQWQVVSGENATDGGSSLYYGNPAVWSYETANTANSGTVQTASFTVPNTPTARLLFDVWLHVESGITYDKVFVYVEPGHVQVWSKGSSLMQQWQTVSVDLSPYKGQPISLAFEFDTYDTLFNVTKGVFIDRMRVLGCNE